MRPVLRGPTRLASEPVCGLDNQTGADQKKSMYGHGRVTGGIPNAPALLKEPRRRREYGLRRGAWPTNKGWGSVEPGPSEVNFATGAYTCRLDLRLWNRKSLFQASAVSDGAGPPLDFKLNGSPCRIPATNREMLARLLPQTAKPKTLRRNRTETDVRYLLINTFSEAVSRLWKENGVEQG
jgi:hypothetical protein